MNSRQQEPLDAGVSPVILKRVLMVLLLMLSPMTPHVAEELWEMLGIPGGIARQKWPAYREDLTREEQIEVIIQINGRLRGKILVDESMTEEETRERALSDPRIKVLAGREGCGKDDGRAQEAGQYCAEVETTMSQNTGVAAGRVERPRTESRRRDG